MHEFAFYSLPVQLPVFGAGLLLYRLLGPDRAVLRRLERWLPAAPRRRAILVALAVLAVGLPLRPAWPPELVAGLPGHVGYGVLFALLAYALATYPLDVLVNPVSRFFGRISYSGYLLHFAVLAGVEGLAAPLVEGRPLLHLALLGTGALAVTAAAAALTYALIEQPGIALGRRLIAFSARTTLRPVPLFDAPQAVEIGGRSFVPTPSEQQRAQGRVTRRGGAQRSTPAGG